MTDTFHRSLDRALAGDTFRWTMTGPAGDELVWTAADVAESQAAWEALGAPDATYIVGGDVRHGEGL